MNIALAVLLLSLGSLALWLLSESSLKWYVKTFFITIFCSFTIVFWAATHSYLGWPANSDDMPEKVVIHWVVIKEPNKLKDYDGNIYFLIEAAEQKRHNIIIRNFGYKKDRVEPRLFELPYSRKLHEQAEQIKKKLQSGQSVMGSLTEKEGEKGKGGKKGGKDQKTKKGGGSESQEQEWQFHELRPSDFQEKPH